MDRILDWIVSRYGSFSGFAMNKSSQREANFPLSVYLISPQTLGKIIHLGLLMCAVQCKEIGQPSSTSTSCSAVHQDIIINWISEKFPHWFEWCFSTMLTSPSLSCKVPTQILFIHNSMTTVWWSRIDTNLKCQGIAKYSEHKHTFCRLNSNLGHYTGSTTRTNVHCQDRHCNTDWI